MRILIVEDVGFVRHNMERLISQQGHAVVTALSGEQALDIMNVDHKIEVVITALFLSGIGGLDLFREAQKIKCIDDSGRPTGPDFILTTTPDRSSTDSQKTVLVQQALDIGFVDVLLKPIDSSQLIARLRQLELGRNGGSAPNGNSTDQTSRAADASSSANQINSEDQIQSLQAIRNTLSQLQKEIKAQIKQLDDSLQTIGK